jgi:hypothetical protein
VLPLCSAEPCSARCIAARSAAPTFIHNITIRASAVAATATLPNSLPLQISSCRPEMLQSTIRYDDSQ